MRSLRPRDATIEAGKAALLAPGRGLDPRLHFPWGQGNSSGQGTIRTPPAARRTTAIRRKYFAERRNSPGFVRTFSLELKRLAGRELCLARRLSFGPGWGAIAHPAVVDGAGGERRDPRSSMAQCRRRAEPRCHKRTFSPAGRSLRTLGVVRANVLDEENKAVLIVAVCRLHSNRTRNAFSEHLPWNYAGRAKCGRKMWNLPRLREFSGTVLKRSMRSVPIENRAAGAGKVMGFCTIFSTAARGPLVGNPNALRESEARRSSGKFLLIGGEWPKMALHPEASQRSKAASP